MSFLHPILLGVGAACVAIPIVIHLLMRRRRKPVRWAAMRFLLEACKQRQRRVQLEHLLLLISRCLLVALIAMAVARPIIGGRDAATAGAREVYLLVDNSLASGLEDQTGSTELTASVGRALALLGTLDSARGDRAALITLGGPARAVVNPPTADLALIERRLSELRPTDSAMDLAGGLAIIPVSPIEEDAPTPAAAVFSAFREGSVGRAAPLPPLVSGVTLRADPPAEALQANLGIASFSLLRPVVVAGAGELVGAGGQARVELLRSGEGLDDGAVTTVRVLAIPDGPPREVGQSVVRWTPGQTDAGVTIDLDLSGLGDAGRVVLRAEIDRDANPRDNASWAVLDVRDKLRVAIVGTRRFGARPRLAEFGPTDWLRLALEPTDEQARDQQIEIEVIDAARTEEGAFAGFDAVIVAEPGRVRPDGWGAIGELRRRGGAVLIAASPRAGAQLWTEQAMSSLGLEWSFERDPVDVAAGGGTLRAPALDGDDLLWFVRGELAGLVETVSVERLLSLQPGADATVLLTSADDRPVLLASAPNAASPRAGQVIVLSVAVDLGWTDLPARPLMVPLVQELVRSSVGAGAPHTVATAGSRVVAPAGAIEISPSRDGSVTAVDPSTGLTREPVRTGGAYEARDPSGVVIGALTVRADAGAGRAGVVPRDRIASWLGAAVGGRALAWSDAGGASSDRGRSDSQPAGPGPGLLLLAAALAIAIVELGLARLVSHASRGGEGV